MDGDGRLRTQHDPLAYQPPGAMGHSQGQVPPGPSAGRLQQPSSVSSRGDQAQAVGRGEHLSGYGGYGYTEQQPAYATPSMHGSAMPTGAIQYQGDYTHDHSRQQQQQAAQPQQQYPQYGSNMVYNVGQPAPPQSPYEPVPQYQQRQSAAIEVLSTQFGVPQYFAPSEAASAGVPAVHSQYLAPQVESASYTQQSPIGRSSAQSYPAAMADFNPMVAAQQETEQQNQVPDPASYDDAYNQYQHALKQTFENTRTGRLVEAGQSLLDISEWLLGHAVELGMRFQPCASRRIFIN